MKNKIAFKLFLYFGATLLLFSIIIGSLFTMLFKNYSLEIQENDLKNRAVRMSDTLSEFINSTSSGRSTIGDKKGGYGAYLRFLDDIAMADVWIVDENLELITSGKINQEYYYNDLPVDAETVVAEVFNGATTSSEGFSNLLKKPTLTVGTPIKYEEKVIGALLLHTPVEGLKDAMFHGFQALGISISIALLLSIILSVVLAISFTKPLAKMKNSSLMLAKGDFSVKTGINQKDEIGELASSIDILSEQLLVASQESDRLLKLRQDFVANISHELRTPVTVIRGSLEAIYDSVVTDPEEVRLYHQQILNETLFLQRLINDLLDLSRLQNTDFKIEMNEINLCDVLNDVVRNARNIALEKNIEIRFEQDVNTLVICGDYGRIRQMLLVILSNAIKFSPKESMVNVSLRDKIVSIKNYGIGILHEDLPYIFDKFYRVKREDNKDGTGLGLSIAKQIADRHNIKILVSSIHNEETVFQFHFSV